MHLKLSENFLTEILTFSKYPLAPITKNYAN